MEFLSHDAKNAINQHKNLEDKYENSCLKFSYLLEEFEEEKHEFECFLKKTWEEIHSFSDKKLILPEEINKVQSLSNITNEDFATVNISTSSYSSTAELYGSTTSHSSTAELYGSDSAECQDISVQTSFQVHSDNSNIFVLPSNHTSVLDVLPSNHTAVSEFDISHMTSHNGYVNIHQILNKVPINETYLLDSPVSAVVNGTKTLSRESDISQKIKIDNLEDVSEKIPNENCSPHSTDDSEKIPNETCNIYSTDNSGKIPNESCNAPSADSFGKMSNQICNPHLTVNSEKMPNGNSSDNSGKIPNKNHNSLMDVCEKSQINVHSKFEDLFRKTYDDQSLYITQMTPTDNNEFFSNEKVSPINKTYLLRNKRTLHGFLSSTFIDNASNQTIEKEKAKHAHLESVNFTHDSEKFLNPNDTNIDMSLIKSLKQKENEQKHTLLVTCVTPITPHDSESSDFSFINPNDTNVCMSLVKRARLEYVEKENELYDNPNDTGNIYSYYHPSKTKHLPSVPFQIKNVSKSEEFLVTSSDKAIEISDVNNKTSLQEAHPLQEVSCLQEVHSLQKNSGISCSMDSLIDFKIHCQTGDFPNKVDLCTQIVQPNTNISKINELTDKIELDKSNVITVKNVRNEHKEKNLSPVLPDTKSETSEPPFSCNTAIINIKNKEIKSANRKKKSRKKVKLCMPSKQPKTDSKYTFVSYSNLRENDMSVNATYLRKISHATNETKVLHCLTESQTKVQHPKKMKENIFSKSSAGRMEKILEINSCEEIKKNVKDSSLLNKNSFNPVAESQNKVKQTNKSKDAFLIKNSPSNLEKVLELNFLSNNSGCLQNFIDIIDDSRNLRRRTNRSCNKDRNSQVIISSNQNDSLQLPQPGRLTLNNTNLLQNNILQRNINDSVKLNCTVCSTSSENSVGASATPISNVLCQKCICALRDIDRKSNVRSSKRLAEKSLLVQTLLGTKRHKSKQDLSYKECDKIPIPTKVTAKILPCSTTNNNTNVNIVDKKTNLNSISSTYALRSRRKNLLSFENSLTEKTDHGKKKKQANKKIYLFKKKKPRKKVKFVDKQTDEELANLERKKTKKTVSMLDDRNSVKEISSNNDTVSTLLTHLNNTVIKKPTKESICVPKEVIRKPARENVCVTKEVIRKPAKENIYVPNKVTTSPTKENICVPQKSILDIPKPFFTKQAEVKKDNVFIMNPPLDNLNNNAIPNLSSTLLSTTNMSRLSGETTASYLGRRKKTLLKKYGNRIMTPDRPPLNSTQIEKLGTSRIFENNDIEVSGISNQTKISRSRLLSLAVENATLGIPETLTQYLNKFNSQTTSLTKK
ncbi:uncharacterized protein LOC100202602 isoform X2 [Hydra vulgaris]|uniref:uncharacterized protein LOC100202602 isoform X2 n=1 Tax=Hydra vulgaris TaxID=6087 RepID=UPI001F5ED83B|nr:uncharacterized protein LOC100202602 isoform X2 [Hydra vulgaris]